MIDIEIKNINDGSTFAVYIDDKQYDWTTTYEEAIDIVENFIETYDLDFDEYCITEN